MQATKKPNYYYSNKQTTYVCIQIDHSLGYHWTAKLSVPQPKE